MSPSGGKVQSFGLPPQEPFQESDVAGTPLILFAGMGVSRLERLLGRHWFLLGLLAVAGVTLGDRSGTVAAAGCWIGAHRGPDAIIVVIFFLSGLPLAIDQVREGISDLASTLLALASIFVLAPLVGGALGSFPLAPGIRIGLLLVAAMPTTLSTGVVMTQAAGGSPANALMITILASLLGTITVPFTLEFLMGPRVDLAAAGFDKWALVVRIASLVVLPLLVGLVVGPRVQPLLHRLPVRLGVISQLLVMVMIWIALSGSHQALLGRSSSVPIAFLLSFALHAVILALIGLLVRSFRIGAGRREAVILMGGQKTLPLSVLLQTSLFPAYGEALVVCVVHHLVHLVMDSYLVGRLASVRSSPDTVGRVTDARGASHHPHVNG